LKFKRSSHIIRAGEENGISNRSHFYSGSRETLEDNQRNSESGYLHYWFMDYCLDHKFSDCTHYSTSSPLARSLQKNSTSQRTCASARVRSKSAMVENSHSDSLNPGAKSGEILPQRSPSTLLVDNSTHGIGSRESNQRTTGAKSTPNSNRGDSSSTNRTPTPGDTKADQVSDNRGTDKINPSTSENRPGYPNGMNNPKNENAPVEEPEHRPPAAPDQRSNDSANKLPSEKGEPSTI